MFVAHLPAGYLLMRFGFRRSQGVTVAAGLAGSVAPDLDLIWFYAVDQRRHLHHEYWTHVPAFWLVVASLSALVLSPGRLRRWRAPTAAFLASVFLHLALDTVAGGIHWLHPWSRSSVVLVEVPARFSWWVLNFVLHPSFLFELALIATAAAVFLRARFRPVAR